jgi:hypothetical protein
MPWDRDRLVEVARSRLDGARLVVVANREPFIHVYDGEDIRCQRPASGLTTALDPVMRACGGVWVGHGSGDADREVVDANSRIAVPPESPSYTLVVFGSRKKRSRAITTVSPTRPSGLCAMSFILALASIPSTGSSIAASIRSLPMPC